MKLVGIIPSRNIPLPNRRPWAARFIVGSAEGPTLIELMAWCEEFLHDYKWSRSRITLWMSDHDAVLFKLRWFMAD
jgi:hypothetical protein